MSEFSKIVRSIKAYLETDKLAGIDELFYEPLPSAKAARQPAAVKEARLRALKKTAEECKLCQLYKKRTNLVFGSGSPDAALMFVGEAPGADEDLKGEPFVGRAGQLLTKMIEAIGMRRDEVYIANILKCRPPNNRSPLPEEITPCSQLVREQITIIQPKVICALGKFASQFLLESQEPISVLRGRFYEKGDTKIMPTFHPAYLLRNPGEKRSVWEDLKKVRDELKK